jgi:hypothetical protein
MDPHVKENVTAQTTWIRGLYILLFAIIYSIAEIVVVAVVVFQFISTLFMGQNNQQLLRLGRSLSEFVRQVLLFVTYNSDEKPFPFGPWPEVGEMALTTTEKKKTTKKTAAKKSPPEESADS